jgi:hypothetical protein
MDSPIESRKTAMKPTPRTKSAKSTAPQKNRLTLYDLPPRNTMRWNDQCKAIVVMAVENGLITQSDAGARYNLSIEEYLVWKRTVKWRDTPKRRPAHAKRRWQIQLKKAA